MSERLKVGEWVTGMSCNGDVIKDGYITYTMNYWGKAIVAVVQPDNSIIEYNCYTCDLERSKLVVYSKDIKDMLELALYYKDYEWCHRLVNFKVYKPMNM